MAVVEVPEVKVEKIGLKPFHEFDAANETWPARRHFALSVDPRFKLL